MSVILLLNLVFSLILRHLGVQYWPKIAKLLGLRSKPGSFTPPPALQDFHFVKIINDLFCFMDFTLPKSETFCIIKITTQWCENHLSKRTLMKHFCLWRVNLLCYEHWTSKQKYFYVQKIICLKSIDMNKEYEHIKIWTNSRPSWKARVNQTPKKSKYLVLFNLIKLCGLSFPCQS